MGGEVEGAEQLRAAVGERADRRVDVVKVMASGGALTPGTDMMACQFTLEELRLIVEESHGHGLGITAHAHGLPAVHQAIDAGVDGIEHCSCLTETKVDVSDQLLDKLAAARVTVCPTMGQTRDAEPPPAIKAMLERIGLTHEGRQEIVGRMYRAGVRLVSGADSGISDGKPHGVLSAGIADFVAGGIPPADALASATSVAAEKCGLGPRKGRLRAGYDADVLIVDGDPLADISALERLRAVYVGGVLAS
jgi:imidazolonepropionase-like amidohydrolase